MRISTYTEELEEHQGFKVHLENFSGPFDLLLSLIAKRELDLTELALSEVTEEFISYMDQVNDLSQTSEFLVVAATLLDAKAARLLPDPEDADDDTLAALEAADLLFSHLLQYRAFKQVATELAKASADAALAFPRMVALEPRFQNLLPPINIRIDAKELAHLAWNVFHQPEPEVETRHVHAPSVSVESQMDLILSLIGKQKHLSFTAMVKQAPTLSHTVALFLAILVLYRDRVIEVEQQEELGEMTLTASVVSESVGAESIRQ